jgi:hypothetical protein
VDLYTRLQNDLLQWLRDDVGDAERGVHKLVDRPPSPQDTPALVVELGVEHL